MGGDQSGDTAQVWGGRLRSRIAVRRSDHCADILGGAGGAINSAFPAGKTGTGG